MKAIGLIVTTGLVAFAAQETAGERVVCWPGECWFPDHMEMLASSYERVDPRADAVVVGRVEVVNRLADVRTAPDGRLYHEDSTAVDEKGSFQLDVVVDNSVAGCYLAGDRFSTKVRGYGRLRWPQRLAKKHWQQKSAEEMAPVLELAEANWNLERELHDRADFGFYQDELPARYERNRQRLLELGMARDLPFLLVSADHGDHDGFGRMTEVVVVPGQRYLMFVSGRWILPLWRRPKPEFQSGLRFDIYPASFAEHLPRADRPKECEPGIRETIYLQ